jgi:hypothetical protein
MSFTRFRASSTRSTTNAGSTQRLGIGARSSSRMNTPTRLANPQPTNPCSPPGVQSKFLVKPPKNSLFRCVGNFAGSHCIRSLTRRQNRSREPKSAKFPVNFPVNGEFGWGDWFDRGCIHHYTVSRLRRFPGGWQIAANWRALPLGFESLQRPMIASRRFRPSCLWARNSVSRHGARRRQKLVRLSRLLRDEAQHPALTRSFGRQVAQAGNSHTVGESPIERAPTDATDAAR